MQREVLAEKSGTFVTCAEDVRSKVRSDRMARRRLETARRKLILAIVKICHKLSDDELVTLADYVLLITA
jgi:hypothetical protein